jgi:hypothetical protein
MYTKSPFASSSAPENSHTPQQPKVGGDDEAVSTDLSVSPQNDKIVQNSEQNAATHVTPSPGAEYSLLNREKEVNDAYDAYLHGSTRNRDGYEGVDMFGPPPALGEGPAYCIYHRLTDEECEKLKHVCLHQGDHTAFKCASKLAHAALVPTHHDPNVLWDRVPMTNGAYNPHYSCNWEVPHAQHQNVRCH